MRVVFENVQWFTLMSLRLLRYMSCSEVLTDFASHTLTVWSLDAVYSTPSPPVPPPPHLTTLTLAVCPPSAYSNLRVWEDHTRTVPSFDDDASRGAAALRCIGSHDSDVIHFECPFSASPIALPVFGSHRRTCPSCPPVASFLSMPSHSTHRTQPLCPESVCDGVSVYRSHRRAVQSPEPVARRFPVGENAAQRIGELWPGRVWFSEHLQTARKKTHTGKGR